MDLLKKKIQDYIREFDVPIYLLEKKINVSGSVIYNILNDNVKNPTIDTVIKIADLLNCSIDELFDRKQYLSNKTFEIKNIKYEHELFRSICLYIFHTIESQKLLDLTLNQVGEAIEETYKFCIEKDCAAVDTKFADWAVSTYLKKTLS